MSILVTDLRDYIIAPTLQFITPEIPYSKQAVQLLLGTAAKESNLGYYIDQTTPGPGPAYGIYQMEEPTYWDHVRWMVANRPLFEKYLEFTGGIVRGAAKMRGDMTLATFMCRVHYFRAPLAIPLTVAGQAAYWKQYYNTMAGSGTAAQYVTSYNQLVGSAGNF